MSPCHRPSPGTGLLSLLIAASVGAVGTPATADDGPLPDLHPTLLSHELVDGELRLTGIVENTGRAPFPAGHSLVVSGSDGVKRYLAMPEIPQRRAWPFSLTLRAVGSSIDLVLDAAPLGRVTESSREDNRASYHIDGLVAERTDAPPTATGDQAAGGTIADAGSAAGADPSATAAAQAQAGAAASSPQRGDDAPDDAAADDAADDAAADDAAAGGAPSDEADAGSRSGRHSATVQAPVVRVNRMGNPRVVFRWPPLPPGADTADATTVTGSLAPHRQDSLAVASAATELPVPAAPADLQQPPDLVVADVEVTGVDSKGLFSIELSVKDIEGGLRGDEGPLTATLAPAGDASWGPLTATIDAADIANGAARVRLAGVIAPPVGRCQAVGSEHASVPVRVRIQSPDDDLRPDNDERSFLLALPCVDAPPLDPAVRVPDPAVLAAVPYVDQVAGRPALKLAVTVDNAGATLSAIGLTLHAAPRASEAVPGSWQQAADSRVMLDDSSPLRGDAPRMLVVCGLGDAQFPLDADMALPGPIGLAIDLDTLPPTRQARIDNNHLVLDINADTPLPPASDTPCGGHPELFGLSSDRVVHTDRAAPSGPVPARVSLEGAAMDDGLVHLRARVDADASGTLAYAWYRDEVWAGGGLVDAAPGQSQVLEIVEQLGQAATWRVSLSDAALVPPPTSKLSAAVRLVPAASTAPADAPAAAPAEPAP